MKLETFLKRVGKTKEDIRIYEGKEALEAVKENGCAIKHVRKQTPELCMMAVKENCWAIEHVDITIFD